MAPPRMMTDRSQPPKDNSISMVLLRASIVLGIVALFLVQLLITFRGLNSPAAMEQAQIARELARGHGLNSKVVRPYAVRQLMEADKPFTITSLPETSQPPLPSLILAPIFKGLESHWENTAETRVYVLDRVVAALSLLFFVGSIGLTMLTVGRLFDQRIANWTALIMIACQLLWQVATTALAPMLLLFLFSAITFLLVLMIERQVDNRGNGAWLALLIGVIAALMVFTNWVALWLLPGLVTAIALLLRPRAMAVLVLIPVGAALLYWGARNDALTGDFLGAAKSTVQSMLIGQPDSFAQRNFTTVASVIDLEELTRHFLREAADQIRRIYEHLGTALPALLFFLALLHPFKRGETTTARTALALMWLGAFIGMSLVGISDDDTPDTQLHYAFIPLFSAYGLAFLFVLWARLPIGQHSGWISRHGVAALAFGITALPMLSQQLPILSAGIRAKGMLTQWPPYIPERFAVLKPMLTQDEAIVCDMPWASAWYTDRPSIWLPRDPAQLEELRTIATKHKKSIAGLVMTPWSAKARNSVSDAVNNQYEPWSPLIYLGVGQWHHVETVPRLENFPYTQILPLHGQFGLRGELLTEMYFITDRKRWQSPEAPQGL